MSVQSVDISIHIDTKIRLERIHPVHSVVCRVQVVPSGVYGTVVQRAQWRRRAEEYSNGCAILGLMGNDK